MQMEFLLLEFPAQAFPYPQGSFRGSNSQQILRPYHLTMLARSLDDLAEHGQQVYDTALLLVQFHG